MRKNKRNPFRRRPGEEPVVLRLSDSIHRIGFSARALHVFEGEGIVSVQKLLEKLQFSRNKHRNFGTKIAAEISQFLRSVKGGFGKVVIPESDFTTSDKKYDHFTLRSLLARPTSQDQIILSRNDLLSKVGFSVRTRHAFENMGISTVGELLENANFDWLSLRNVGKGTVTEISDFLKSLQEEAGPFVVLDVDPSVSSKNDARETSAQTTSASAVKFTDDNGFLREDIPVRSLNLSVRATNVLREANITSARQLLNETEQSLLRFHRSGRKTACEIIEKVKKRTRVFQDADSAPPHGNIQSLLMARFSPNKVSLSLGQLLSGLTHPATSIATDLLHQLVETGKLRKEGDLYVRDFPSILEFVKSLEDDRIRSLVLGRLSGNSLEKLGTATGVTRERVRQIIRNALSKRPSVREDRYSELFFKYDFRRDDFCEVFSEPAATYNYLECLRSNKKPRKPVEALAADLLVLTPEQRERLHALISSDVVFIDGATVPRVRTEVLRAFIKTRLKDGCPISEALQRYRKFIHDLSLPESEFEYDDHSFEGRMNDSPYTLAGPHFWIRTYDTTRISLAMLVDDYELNRFRDVEISTSLLVREFPEVMRRYGVLDAYELHNLFRKVAQREKGAMYCVSRMPHLFFGNVDVKAQIQDLYDSVAPITMVKLTELYEETFGVAANLVAVTRLKLLDKSKRLPLPKMPGKPRRPAEPRIRPPRRTSSLRPAARKGPESIPLDPTSVSVMATLERFPNGFRPESPIDVNKFSRYFEESFGKMPPDNFIETIRKNGIQTSGRIHALTPAMRECVAKAVEREISAGQRIFFFEEVFHSFLTEFLDCGISNVDLLRVVVRNVFPQMRVSGNRFTVDGSVSVNTEIERIFSESLLMSFDTLHARLPFVPVSRIKVIVTSDASRYVRNANGEYAFLPGISFDDHDVEAARILVEKDLRDKGYSSIRYFDVERSAELNTDITDIALRTGLFERFLSSEFDRTNSLITWKGESLNDNDVFERFCLSRDSFTLADLNAVESELTGRCVNCALGVALEHAIRLDRDTFVSIDAISFNVSATDATLATICANRPTPLRIVNDFSFFPPLENHCWTLFLLESYCRRKSARFSFSAPSPNSSNIGIIHPKSSVFKGHNRMAADILRRLGALDETSVKAQGERLGLFAGMKAKTITAIYDLVTGV